MMKQWLDEFIRFRFAGKDLGRMSCEDIADEIFAATAHESDPFPCHSVCVFEDGENGVEAYYEPK